MERPGGAGRDANAGVDHASSVRERSGAHAVAGGPSAQQLPHRGQVEFSHRLGSNLAVGI
jgi:hypothetical protein